MSKFDTVKETVEATLAAYPDTRNSDKLLTIKIWSNDLAQVSKIVNFKKLFSFNLKDCGLLTNPLTITRMRRHIQNTEGRLLPTDPEVIKKRAKNKELIEEWLRKAKEGTIEIWF